MARSPLARSAGFGVAVVAAAAVWRYRRDRAEAKMRIAKLDRRTVSTSFGPPE